MQHKCKITVLRKECYTIACCNDGTRPVIFKIERIDEKE